MSYGARWGSRTHRHRQGGVEHTDCTCPCPAETQALYDRVDASERYSRYLAESAKGAPEDVLERILPEKVRAANRLPAAPIPLATSGPTPPTPERPYVRASDDVVNRVRQAVISSTLLARAEVAIRPWHRRPPPTSIPGPGVLREQPRCHRLLCSQPIDPDHGTLCEHHAWRGRRWSWGLLVRVRS